MILHSCYTRRGKATYLLFTDILGMCDNWKTLAGQYVEEGFQTHALDMRNHGKSFHSDEFTYDAMVQDLVEYM